MSEKYALWQPSLDGAYNKRNILPQSHFLNFWLMGSSVY